MKSKRKTKMIRDRIIVYVITSALLFCVICVLMIGALALTLKITTFSFTKEYTIYYGTGNAAKRDMESLTYKEGQYGYPDTIYVNFSEIAEYCGFYVSGGGDRLRYIIPASNGSEDSQFVASSDSNRIDLNGTVVHLSAPAVIDGSNLYMPIEFFERYVNGISVEQDEKDEDVYILRCDKEMQIYLTASKQESLSSVDRSALDESGA